MTATSTNGYWIQDPNPDDDPNTSEGIFVFRGTGVAVNDSVLVTGNVSEFRPGTGQLTLTELTNSFAVPDGPDATIEPTLIGPGGLTPPTTVIEDDATDVEDPADNEFDPQQDGIDFHESLEGMLVRIDAPEAVGPTNGFGETATVPAGLGGPFTPRGGIYVTPADFNPERLIFDDVVADVPDVNTGDAFQGPVDAVVDYAFGNYKYYPTSTPARIDRGLQPEVTDAPKSNQLAISSMNVENLDALESQSKYDRLARIVVDNLRSPDILAVEEIQDNDGAVSPAPTNAEATYRRFIETIAAQGGPTYEFRQIDPESNEDGGEPNGNIRVGFLYRTDRGVRFVDRPGATATTPNAVVKTSKGAQLLYSPGRIDPTNPAFNDSRKPLAAEFTWKGRTVFAIANHFNSKGGDDPLFGRRQPPVQVSAVQRHKQAEVLSGFVTGPPRGRPARRRRRDGRLQRLPVLRDARDPGGRRADQPDGDPAGGPAVLVRVRRQLPGARPDPGQQGPAHAHAGVRLGARQRRVHRPGVRSRPAGRARRRARHRQLGRLTTAPRAEARGAIVRTDLTDGTVSEGRF